MPRTLQEDDDLYSALYRDKGYGNGPTGALWKFLCRDGREPPARTRVLDAGCGRGQMVEFFQRKDYVASGIDISSFAVQGNKSLLHGTITDLPFKDGSFDLAWCCDVLEHLAPDAVPKAISELKRVAPRLVASISLRESGFAGDTTLHQSLFPLSWWLGQVGSTEWYGSPVDCPMTLFVDATHA